MRTTTALLALVLLPAVALAASAAGRPDVKPTSPPGVYLWHDDAGWHVRVAAGGDQRAVRGTIRGAGFRDLSVTRPPLASKTSIPDPTFLRFQFDVFKNTVDGFDWQAEAGCLTVEVRVDGKPQPRLVRLGAKAEPLSVFPADACP